MVNLIGWTDTFIRWFALLMVGITIIVITLSITWWIKRQKMYSEYKLVIFHHDGLGNLNARYDTAGIFINRKTKSKRLWLKGGKVGLTPDNVPFIRTPRGKVVYLYQNGSKNYRFIDFGIERGEFLFTVGEEDVNWATHDYEIDKQRFLSDKLLQYLPYISLGIVSIVILIIFIYFFKNFGVLKEVAEAFKEASKNLILAKDGGTTIITP